MTTTERMDGDLRAWLLAQERPATYLDDVRAATAEVRQQRAAGPLSWVPFPAPFAQRPLTVQVLVALLALAMLAGTLAVGAAILRDRAVIPVQTEAPRDLQAFQVAERSNSAWIGIPLEVEVRTGGTEATLGEGERIRYLADGAGRFRIERSSGTRAQGEVRIDFVGGDTWYVAETLYSAETGPDGVTRWWDESAWSHFDPYASMYGSGPYPMEAPFPCSGGWEFVGVGTVIGRATHHIRCGWAGRESGLEAWVDRETFIVLRTVGGDLIGSPDGGVREVVRISFGPQDASLFELPPDASPVPRT